MDAYGRTPNCSDVRDRSEATIVAESVRLDFANLVSLLNGQLANDSNTDQLVRSHMLEAKFAAQRGLDLSGELISLLRSVEMKR